MTKLEYYLIPSLRVHIKITLEKSAFLLISPSVHTFTIQTNFSHFVNDQEGSYFTSHIVSEHSSIRLKSASSLSCPFFQQESVALTRHHLSLYLGKRPHFTTPLIAQLIQRLNMPNQDHLLGICYGKLRILSKKSTRALYLEHQNRQVEIKEPL